MGKLLAALAAHLMLTALAYFGAVVALLLVFNPTGWWSAPIAAAIAVALYFAGKEIDC